MILHNCAQAWWQSLPGDMPSLRGGESLPVYCINLRTPAYSANIRSVSHVARTYCLFIYHQSEISLHAIKFGRQQKTRCPVKGAGF